MNKKKVSIKEVAREAGVSPGTISNYLNKSAPVNSKTQSRIKNAIQKLGYKRNEIASSLRRSQTNTIGLILPDIRNPFYADFYYSIENEALNNNYNVIFVNSDYNHDKIIKYTELLINRGVDGLIISGNYAFRLKNLVEKTNIPIVIFEPKILNTGFASLAIDNENSAFNLMEYLIKKGHKDIAVITPSVRSARFQGYKKALINHNLPIKDELIHEFGFFNNNLYNHGFNSMNHLMAQTEFSACFIISDMVAIGALSAIKKKGLKVPDDIAIAGFDNIPFSALIDPPLTTIQQPVQEMGEYAFSLCLDLINDKNNININTKIFNTELIIRDSA